MRSYPDKKDKYDLKEPKNLNAEPWMVRLLKFNPSYTCWGPYEDYMGDKSESWSRRVIVENWSDFNWNLDEYNEVVNFYFEVNRESKTCESCDGQGVNPETKQISDDFYDFANTGRRWCDQITQDEVEALQAKGRLRVHGKDGWEKKEGLTAEEVNAANRKAGLGDFNHDAINRWILIETRAKRLGVYGKCKMCKGEGHIYTEPSAKVGLVLWVLHPRKGCSRGVHIKNISQEDLPKVFKFLQTAEKRNRKRFSAVMKQAVSE